MTIGYENFAHLLQLGHIFRKKKGNFWGILTDQRLINNLRGPGIYNLVVKDIRQEEPELEGLANARKISNFADTGWA